MMAVAPVVLLAGIGIHARTYVDLYEWPETTEDHARVNAYVGVSTEALNWLYYRHTATEDKARKIAKLMIDGERAMTLRPLQPRNVDEFMTAGVKGKVIELGQSPARRLLEFSSQRIQEGDPIGAARNLQLASDSLNVFKYSNFMTLFRISLLQGQILRKIEEVYPKLSNGERHKLDLCMERMKGDMRKYAKLASNAKRVIIAEYREHENLQAALETASKLVPERTFFEQPALAKEKLTQRGNYQVDDTIIPNQRIEARQCLIVDQKNRLAIQRITSLNHVR